MKPIKLEYKLHEHWTCPYMYITCTDDEYKDMLVDVISEQRRLNDEIKTIDLTKKEGLGNLQACSWVAGQLKIYRRVLESVVDRVNATDPLTKAVFTSSIGHRSTLSND